MQKEELFTDEIVQPGDVPDAGVKVRMGPPIPVMTAPEGGTTWGMFSFPSLWRLRDGRLVCMVTMGEDERPSDADYHYLWYTSEDDGRHWLHVVPDIAEAEGFLRERITLRDECLDGELFLSVAEARYIVERWRLDYNHHRPHSRLGWQTPVEFAKLGQRLRASAKPRSSSVAQAG